MTLKIYCDGGARGNPGPAAIGCLVKNLSGRVIYQHRAFIGVATNNVAEYRAVIAALSWLADCKLTIRSCKFFLDSTLVVNQLSGNYKVKNPNLKSLHQQAIIQISNLKFKVSFTHIPRQHNFQADALVNQALDEQRL